MNHKTHLNNKAKTTPTKETRDFFRKKKKQEEEEEKVTDYKSNDKANNVEP